MSESSQCTRCGGTLPESGELRGRCPRCMLELGYETASGGPEDVAFGAIPAAIGRYRILRVIGQGGMGIVYEAEQEQPRRIVALKIIRYGMATPQLLRRFEQESQALGRLQHPGIAQIYEAGTVDTGFGPQPYFAMELIRGLPPREHAELYQLNTRQRVNLMVKFCDAVHHAHQRGLIHRDLKPANILVDETGQPKILDFGVARVTDSDTRTTQSESGQLIGTLAYMSPEQTLADPELDTRSDVYSLGVIFYELLTGRLPYTISRNIPEAIRSIQDDDPAKIRAVDGSYRGDIETIVGKVLEKDKTRRYQSAFGLSADLQRYLNDEPIAARPPSVGYLLRKFASRHKALVSGVVAVFIALVLGVAFVGSTLGWRRADTGAKKSLAILRCVDKVFPVDPHLQEPGITMKETLDRSVTRIPEEYKDLPLEEAACREFVADRYAGIGRDIEARDQLEVAVTLRRLGPDGDTNPEILQARAKLANAYFNLKMYSMSEEHAKKVVTDARRSDGEVGASVGSAITTIVSIYNADPSRGFSQIEAFLKDVLDYQRKNYGVSDATFQVAVEAVFSLYKQSKPTPKYVEAAQFMQEIVDDMRQALGEGNGATLKAEKELINILTPPPDLNDAEAEKFLTNLKGVRKYQQEKYGVADPIFQGAVYAELSFYKQSKPTPKYLEAAQFMQGIVDDMRQSLGESNLLTLKAEKELIAIYLTTQPAPDYAAAEKDLTFLIEAQRSTLGDDHPVTRATINDLSTVQRNLRQRR